MNWRDLVSFLMSLFLIPTVARAVSQSSNSSVTTKIIDGKTVVEYSLTQTIDGETTTKSQSFEVTGPFQLTEQLDGSSINVSVSGDSNQTIFKSQQNQTNQTTTTSTKTRQNVRLKTTQVGVQTPTKSSAPTPTPNSLPTTEVTSTSTPQSPPTSATALNTQFAPSASLLPTDKKINTGDEVITAHKRAGRPLATAIILLVIDVILIGVVILLWFFSPKTNRLFIIRR